jgi:folate-binding protein YgfZ
MSDIHEYEALRSGRGFVELANWSTVVVTGTDRLRFLNSFCTNDVKQLSAGASAEAFITDVKGRTIGQVWIVSHDEEAVIVGPPGQASRLVAHFDKYIIREDVQVADATNDRAWLLVTGSDFHDLPAMEARLLAPVRCGLLMSHRASLQEFQLTLIQQGFITCSRAAFDALRIEAGLPLFGIDFGDSNFPQEVGRDREAISFTKGCYLGQETVARIDALGHVNQRIVGVRLNCDDVPPPGVELTHDAKVVGRVNSVTFSPRLGRPLGLAMVRREQSTAGSRLESSVGTWEVVTLPLE